MPGFTIVSLAMLGVVILLMIVGASGAVLTVLLVRSFAGPRRVGALASMLKQGRTRQVVAGARQVLARDPRSTDARWLLALAHLKENRPELALIEVRAINEAGVFTAFCPEESFRRQAGELYARFGHGEEALKEYLLLLKAAPGEAEYAFRAGELFEQRGNLEKAAGFYARAVQLRSTHAEANARLGCLHYRAKRTAEARPYLEAAVKLDPQNSTACYYLGRILRDGGDSRGALKLLEQAARDPSNRARALLEAGSCSLAAGDHERAAADLGRAIKAAAGQDEGIVLYARYFLGVAFEKAREYGKAVGQFELVQAAKPGFRDVAEKLAMYRDLHQDDDMKDYLTAQAAEFCAICRRIAESLRLEVSSAREIPEGCELQALDAPSGMVQRRMTHLMRFLRPSRPIDEPSVRSFLERMRSVKADRGLYASSTGFSTRAVAFAQSRPVELAGHEKLVTMIKAAETGP